MIGVDVYRALEQARRALPPGYDIAAFDILSLGAAVCVRVDGPHAARWFSSGILRSDQIMVTRQFAYQAVKVVRAMEYDQRQATA